MTKISFFTYFIESICKKLGMKGDKNNSQKCRYVLQCACKGLRDDKEIVLYAIKRSGKELEFANDELRGYKEVVLGVVKNDGTALYYADDDLRRDREYVSEAVRYNWKAEKYALI